MEILRRLLGDFRRAHVESRDHLDAMYWTRMLAVYQMTLSMSFLVIIPTYMMAQIILSGIVEQIYPQEPSCFSDINWKPGKTCRLYKPEELKFTNHYLIDAHLKEVALLFFNNFFKTIAHCVAAILLRLATHTDATRSQQLKYCLIAITVNLIYLAQEYFSTTCDVSVYLCIIYRGIFNLKVHDFYCSIKENAQQPPGHKQFRARLLIQS